MFELTKFFPLSATYAFFCIAIAGLVGFIVGYFLRSGIIVQHKKRILDLEEEMLSNHSQILELEKQINDLKNEKLIRNGKQPVTSKTESKAS